MRRQLIVRRALIDITEEQAEADVVKLVCFR